MQILLIYLFLFIVGCILGWFIEVLFRRFFSAKRWVNPGFMKGPWLPLYGFGVIVMFTLSFVCVSFFPENMQFYNPLGGLFERDYISGPTINDLIPILLMWIGMLLLEFFAGVTMSLYCVFSIDFVIKSRSVYYMDKLQHINDDII